MRKRRNLSQTILLCAVFLTGYAGSGESGTIEGTITDQSSGLAVALVDIDVLDAALQSFPTTAFSDASGFYQVTNVPAGDYIIRADPNVTQGYVDQYNGGVFLRSQASFFTVPAIGTVTVDFSLFQGGRISGRVTVGSGPDAGTGAAGVDLDVYDAGTGEFIASVNASTDGTGNYTIGAFPPGQYLLAADPDPSTFLIQRFYLDGEGRATATPIQVLGTETVSPVDFSVPAGGLIEGIVRDSGTLAPVAGIDIDVFTALGVFQRANAVTSATGYYRVGPVLPDTYIVQADATALTGYVPTYHVSSFTEAGAAPVSVSINAITPDVDIDLPVGGTISGTVMETGTLTTLVEIDIDVFDTAGTLMPVHAKTDASGNYIIGGLPSGNYVVRADPTLAQGYAPQFYPGVTFEADALPVAVTAGSDRPNVDFLLSAACIIQGIVTGSDTLLPVAGIDLDLFDTGGRFYSAADAVTSSTGFYQLGPVPSGQWVLQADPTLIQAYVDEYYDGEYALSRATVLNPGPGAVLSGIDIVLDRGGTVSGTIRSAAGNDPLPGVDIDVFLPDGRRIDVTTTTGLDGNYTLGLLPPGQYVIRADPAAVSGLAEIYYNGVYTLPEAQLVTVTVNADTPGVDFLLPFAAATSVRDSVWRSWR